MKRATAEWVEKAEEDYAIARRISRNEIPLHDGVCFHSQQCAEKYLKGLLEELRQPSPKTHDLDLLLNMLLPSHPSLRGLRRGLIFLSKFAVDPRYPGLNANKRKAEAAMRWTDRVRTEARSLLGIRPRRPRRKKSP